MTNWIQKYQKGKILPEELQNINNLYPPKQTYFVPTSYRTPELIKAQKEERILNNISAGLSDIGTGLITWGTQFRPPEQKELESARAGWKGRLPLLAQGVTYGLGYDMLGAGMSFLAPKIASELITGKVTKEALGTAGTVAKAPIDFIKGVKRGVENVKLVGPATEVLNRKALGKFEEIRRLKNLVGVKGLEDPTVLNRIINSSVNDDVLLNLFGKNRKDLAGLLSSLKSKTSAINVATTGTEVGVGAGAEMSAADRTVADYLRRFNLLEPGQLERLRRVRVPASNFSGAEANVSTGTLNSQLAPPPEFVSFRNWETGPINWEQFSSNSRLGWDFRQKVEDAGDNFATKLMLAGRKDIIPYKNIKNTTTHLGSLFDPKIAGSEIQRAANDFSNAPKGYHIASTSLSDSSFPLYASKVADIVGKTPNTKVFFSGYSPLNSMGILSQSMQTKDIANYLNTKISGLNIQGRRIPKVITKNIEGNESIWYPKIVVQKYKWGGQINWLEIYKAKKRW